MKRHKFHRRIYSDAEGEATWVRCGKVCRVMGHLQEAGTHPALVQRGQFTKAQIETHTWLLTARGLRLHREAQRWRGW